MFDIFLLDTPYESVIIICVCVCVVIFFSFFYDVGKYLSCTNTIVLRCIVITSYIAILIQTTFDYKKCSKKSNTNKRRKEKKIIDMTKKHKTLGFSFIFSLFFLHSYFNFNATFVSINSYKHFTFILLYYFRDIHRWMYPFVFFAFHPKSFLKSWMFRETYIYTLYIGFNIFLFLSSQNIDEKLYYFLPTPALLCDMHSISLDTSPLRKYIFD